MTEVLIVLIWMPMDLAWADVDPQWLNGCNKTRLTRYQVCLCYMGRVNMEVADGLASWRYETSVGMSVYVTSIHIS